MAYNLINRNVDIQFFNQMVSNFVEDNRKEQHVITGIDNEQVCFEINTDTIKVLSNYGINSNAKDTIGNVPLIYAIDMQHMELIDELLKLRTSVNSDKTRNRGGYTPLTYSLNKLRNSIDTINIQRILTTYNDRVKNTIIAESNYSKILNRSQFILPMIFYLFNHQLMLMELEHYNPDPNKLWEFKDHTDLFNLLNITDTSIPLINKINSDIFNVNQGVERLLSKKRQEINKLNDEQTRLNNMLRNINLEIDSLENTTVFINQLRIKRLTDLKTTIETKIADNTIKLTTFNTELTNLQNKLTTDVDNDAVLNNLKADLLSLDFNIDNNYVTNLYDGIFDKINFDKFNTSEVDLNSYYKMWNNLLSISLIDDYTQLPLLCLYKISGIESDGNYIENLGLISRFWKNVLSEQINNYLTLPKYYNKFNYLLNSLVKIYSHTIKHTLCTNYYFVLFKLVSNYITTKYPPITIPNNYDEFIKNKISSIFIDSNLNKNSLLNYILNELPEKMVKNILRIYEHDNDPIIETNPTSLLQEAVNIIIQNNSEPITENERFIKNIKEYIIPYFEKYFTMYIIEAHKMINEYVQNMKKLSTDMIIFSKLYEYSKNENR